MFYSYGFERGFSKKISFLGKDVGELQKIRVIFLIALKLFYFNTLVNTRWQTIISLQKHNYLQRV